MKQVDPNHSPWPQDNSKIKQPLSNLRPSLQSRKASWTQRRLVHSSTKQKMDLFQCGVHPRIFSSLSRSHSPSKSLTAPTNSKILPIRLTHLTRPWSPPSNTVTRCSDPRRTNPTVNYASESSIGFLCADTIVFSAREAAVAIARPKMLSKGRKSDTVSTALSRYRTPR